VLVFVSTAGPLAEEWREPADQERFRAGTGVMVSLGR
jgi:hypothetical protein